MFQGNLWYKLSVGALYRRNPTVIPEKDMQDHAIVACVEVMAVCRPPGGVTVDFDIPAVPRFIVEGNRSLLKIWTCLQVPTSRRMDHDGSPIQSVQPRGTPTLIEPQALYQLLWNRVAPGSWCFGKPGTRWYRRVEGVPEHG
jgi:hypothetical protein